MWAHKAPSLTTSLLSANREVGQIFNAHNAVAPVKIQILGSRENGENVFPAVFKRLSSVSEQRELRYEVSTSALFSDYCSTITHSSHQMEKFLVIKPPPRSANTTDNRLGEQPKIHISPPSQKYCRPFMGRPVRGGRDSGSPLPGSTSSSRTTTP